MTVRRIVAAALGAALLSACSSFDYAPGAPLSTGSARSAEVERATGSSGKVQHVVVIVQENRSFDNLFQGFPGADTQAYGYISTGKKVALKPVTMATHWDIEHSSREFFAACDGSGSIPGTNCKMDGFDKEHLGCGFGFQKCPIAHPQYAYVPAKQSAPYFAIAKQYVLADRMFTSNFDGSSFISHQYIIAGQANSTVDFPISGYWGCEGGPSDTINTLTQQRTYGPAVVACFDDKTLGDELDSAGISWRYYTSSLTPYTTGSLWNAYQAISHIYYGPDWSKDVKSPQTQFFTDIKHGKLPAVSWVTPTCRNSDHAGCGSADGPQWVTNLVNAVGQSKYWNSTAIFIFWDDYGGWYDHVPPPYADYDGLGIRVPLIVVSPYAKQGYVSHEQYEHGSILKFIEDQFGLPRLAASDMRAKSPAKDCFDFSQPPRAFTPFATRLSESYFLHEPIDPRPVDTQ